MDGKKVHVFRNCFKTFLEILDTKGVGCGAVITFYNSEEKNLTNITEIKQNWTTPKNFDNYFHAFLDQWWKKLTFRGGH